MCQAHSLFILFTYFFFFRISYSVRCIFGSRRIFMKKRYKALFAALLTGALAAGCLAGCGKMDGTAGGKMKKCTLNEVAHSIFYVPPIRWPLNLAILRKKGIDLTLVMELAQIGNDSPYFRWCPDRVYGIGSKYLCKSGRGGRSGSELCTADPAAGNFLVGRTAQPDFKWEDLKGKKFWAEEQAVCPRWYLNIS